jgi:hypothetical protein
MSLRYLWALLLCAGAGAASDARAQYATQVVTFRVVAINRVAVSGNPDALIVSTAAAGQEPTSATATGSTYAITTNEPNKKITASVDQPLPSGIVLEVALAAPAGASSHGSVVLTTAGSDVVTGISATTAGALPITYRLSASPAAQVTAPAARTVTFTIVSGS